MGVLDFMKPKLTPRFAEKLIFSNSKADLGIKNLLVRCDEDLGGFSTASLSLRDAKPGKPPYVRFQGETSLDLPEDRPEVIRLGYAMFRTQDLPGTMFGLGPPAFHDWSDFNQITMRVRGDYRKYFINIQADTPYPTDLYQHRLFLKTPGQWENVTVAFPNFILTNGGVIQQQQPLNAGAIKSIGIGLVDGQYGPYQLDLEWIKVHGNDQVDSTVETLPSSSEDNDGAVEPDASTPMGMIRAEPSAKNKQVPGKRLSVDD